MGDEPREPGTEVLLQSLAGMAVESWRLRRLFENLVEKLDAGEKSRHQSKLLYHARKVEDCLASSGLQLVDLTEQPFDTGMAATPINVADFSPGDRLVVDQVLEPTVMGRGGLVRPGTVLLRKAAR